MSLLGLATILGEERPGTEFVAFHRGAPVSIARLRGEIRHNARRFDRLEIRRALLCCEDAYPFVVGLLALLKIGADIVLPPNLQSGTIAGLADDFDALVTDAILIDEARALAIEPAEPSAVPLSLGAA